jgi:predicted MFS family arabinose efflux permease
VIAGLLRGPEDGWGAAQTVAMLAAGAMLLVAFAVVELRRHAPMLDPRLFGDQRLSATTAVAFLQSVAIYPMLLFLAVDLQIVHGFSPLDAGLRVLPVTATLLVAAVVTGRLTERVPHRVTLALGLAGTAVGLLLLRGGEPSDEWTVLLPGFLVLGTGLGILSPSVAAAIMATLPVRQGGMASAIGNTARQAGIATGVAVLGAVFSAAATGAGDAQALLVDGAQTDAAKAAFLSGLDAALAVAAGVAVLGAGVAWLVPSLSSGSNR